MEDSTRITNLENKIAELERKLNSHRHTGADLSSPLAKSITEPLGSFILDGTTFSVAGNLNPSVTGTYTLGSSSKEWEDLYVNDIFSNIIMTTSLSVNTVPIVGYFTGKVLANGTASTPFPTGWSSAKIGTGDYDITHSLGQTNYIVTAISADQAYICVNTERTTTTFTIQTYTVVPAVADTIFNFMVMLT